MSCDSTSQAPGIHPQSRANQASSSSWLNATTGVTAVAPPPHEQHNAEKPRENTRRERIQEYMRAYANGEVGRDRGGGSSSVQPTTQQTDIEMAEEPVSAQQQPLPLTPEQASAYQSFLQQSHHRRLRRHDLATRDAIWADSIARTTARLEAVNAEKASLELKLVGMRRERERYSRENVVEVDEEGDRSEERRWEEWLRVRAGVVVGVGVAGKEGGEGEEDEGGVDV